MTTQQSQPRQAIIVLASSAEYFVVDRLVDAYRDCGFRPRYVGWDRLEKLGSSENYRETPCRYIMRGWGYANWRLLLALPLWCVRLFLHLLVQKRCVVHAVDFECAFPAAVAALFRKHGVVYDIQDNFEERHAYPPPVKALLRTLNLWTVRRCPEIVVTDENRLRGGLESFRHKISIVGNCPPDFAAAASSGQAEIQDAGSLVVAAFGNLASARGIALLNAACARVPGVKCVIAGRFNEPWLESAIRQSASAEYLGMLSQEEALVRLFQTDVVFSFYDVAVPINRMASSAKWYDAMMAGKPVLSNREIINAPWIEREGFGYTCAYDEDSLVSALTWIRDHPEERAERGAKARQLFESTFNRSAMNAKICGAAQRAAEAAGSC